MTARANAWIGRRIAVQFQKPTVFAVPVTPASTLIISKPKVLKRAAIHFSLFAVMAALAGCAVGPDYHQPASLPGQVVPKTFSDDSTNQVIWKIAEPSANVPRGEWWQMFGDTELNRLQSLAATNNQNLQIAAARFEQARALTSATRSEFFPQLTAGGTPNGDITRQRTSFNQPQQGKAAGTTHTYDTFTAPLYLGWELDLWGRVRRLSEGAQARFAAAADDVESAKLGVAAEVANDYFTLCALQSEHDTVTNTIVAYRRSLELTQNLRRGGAVSDLDVAQAATQLHSAEAQLPVIDLQTAQLRHALAILCGQSPIDFSIATLASNAAAVPVIPSTLPGELLEHRPDIAAAERRMIAANAGVGVAKAAFFPKIKFDGLAGFQSVGAGSLFNWPSRFWSVGPSIEVPLFTGGLNRANLAAAHAAYDETVAAYRQTVLDAFGEVENALAAQQLLAEQWIAETAALDAARRSLEISNNRYQAGLVTYLDVATAQTAALAHERAVTQLSGARLNATVNLVKSLGAGWTVESRKPGN
jgi:NodT family efflux transporter outer membrane factor (OMF) lipoprotein